MCFAIMMVTCYAGTGCDEHLRDFDSPACVLRVEESFRLYRFPDAVSGAEGAWRSPEAKAKSEGAGRRTDCQYRLCTVGYASTAGPGRSAMIISSASTVRHGSGISDWVIMVAPPIILRLLGLSCGAVAQFRGIMRLVRQRWYRSDFSFDGLLL